MEMRISLCISISEFCLNIQLILGKCAQLFVSRSLTMAVCRGMTTWRDYFMERHEIRPGKAL